MKQEQQDRSFDVVRVKYIKPDSVKTGMFTKLEASISQRRNQTTLKNDSGANGNLMVFKLFKSLFPKSTIEALHAT